MSATITLQTYELVCKGTDGDGFCDCEGHSEEDLNEDQLGAISRVIEEMFAKQFANQEKTE